MQVYLAFPLYTVSLSEITRGALELKRRIASMLFLLALMVNFSCGSKPPDEPIPLSVVATFLPLQVFAANVIGTRQGVVLDRLLPAQGIDPHNYSMSPKDVSKLWDADVVITNGFGFEAWLGDTINDIKTECLVITASDGITPIYYGKDSAENEAEHKGDINPHCWASPKSAIKMVENIRDGLIKADPAGAEIYKANAENYINRLKALDAQITEALAGRSKRGIVTFHNAFDYVARDYGLNIIAVIETHAGQQPSAGELAKLANLMKESDVRFVFAEPQYPAKVADVLAKETDAEVLILDPYASGEFSLDGYESIWQANLKNLAEALS